VSERVRVTCPTADLPMMHPSSMNLPTYNPAMCPPPSAVPAAWWVLSVYSAVSGQLSCAVAWPDYCSHSWITADMHTRCNLKQNKMYYLKYSYDPFSKVSLGIQLLIFK